MNPTNAVLEERVAALEGGIAALAVASGMAAVTYAIQTIAQAGDNIVSVSKLYGGTYNLFAHTFPRQGLTVKFAPHNDVAALEALIDENTKAVFRSEEHTSELQSLMRISYAVFCLKKKKQENQK